MPTQEPRYGAQYERTTSQEPDLGCLIRVSTQFVEDPNTGKSRTEYPTEVLWPPGATPTDDDRAEAELRAAELAEQTKLQEIWPTRRLLLIVVRYLLWAMSKRLLPKPDADSRLGKDLARLAAMVGADQEEAGGGKLRLGAKLV